MDDVQLSAEEQQVAVHIFQGQAQAAADILQEGGPAERPRVLAANAQAYVDALVAEAPGPPRACAVGCTFCCYLPVTVEAPEPFAIVHFLQTTLTPEERAAVWADLERRVEARRGWTVQQRVAARWPCVFLKEGRCSIYPVRPLACRGYQSFSRDACETAYKTQAQVPEVPTVDRVAWLASYAVRHGLRSAVQRAGLDADAPELESAVRVAWARPEAAARWGRGKRVYGRSDRL